MKRNKEMVPEFDEIIFENRNKTYGAYDIRRRYKSTTSLSILGGIAFSAILMTALSFTNEKGTKPIEIKGITVTLTPVQKPDFVPPQLPKTPPALTRVISNLKPVVTEDTSKVTPYLPTADENLINAQNGKPVDISDPQTDPKIIPPEPAAPLICVEEMPDFPGGMSALLKYIADNLNYPSEAQSNNIQGRVILKFVVNSDGSVDRIEILKGVDPLLDNEAVRVVKMLPKFKPGRQGGVAVPVWFTLPVSFKIGTF